MCSNCSDLAAKLAESEATVAAMRASLLKGCDEPILGEAGCHDCGAESGIAHDDSCVLIGHAGKAMLARLAAAERVVEIAAAQARNAELRRILRWLVNGRHAPEACPCRYRPDLPHEGHDFGDLPASEVHSANPPVPCKRGCGITAGLACPWTFCCIRGLPADWDRPLGVDALNARIIAARKGAAIRIGAAAQGTYDRLTGHHAYAAARGVLGAVLDACAQESAEPAAGA